MAGRHSAATAPSATAGRRGLRIALLTLAVAILLVGAATAGVYGYAAISHAT